MIYFLSRTCDRFEQWVRTISPNPVDDDPHERPREKALPGDSREPGEEDEQQRPLPVMEMHFDGIALERGQEITQSQDCDWDQEQDPEDVCHFTFLIIFKGEVYPGDRKDREGQDSEQRNSPELEQRPRTELESR